MAENKWVVLGYCVLFALCFACGGGGGSSYHGSSDHGGSLASYPGHDSDHHKNGGSEKKNSGSVKKSKEPEEMKHSGDKPLPNTVAVRGQGFGVGTLYKPADGYVWSDTGDRELRTWSSVVSVVKQKKKK